jgi:hypothetical protein
MVIGINMVERIELTKEEAFLWACGRSWRLPDSITPPAGLDWERVVAMARHNRMQTLLHGIVATQGLLASLPAAARTVLEEDATRMAKQAGLLGGALQRYLREAAERQIETVVLKGLSVSANVYGNVAMRPGGDIDILVRQGEVEACLQILDEMGIGRYWPNLMDDRYYERHHLHQQRCTPDLQIWFEIHWALDHPLTRLTVDYEAMMDRTTSGTLLGEPVRDLALPDLLLSLAIHLVKHAVYLPSALARPDLSRLILGDGMLMYYLDVAEVVKQHGPEIDWQSLIAICRQSGTAAIMGSVLQVCGSELLDAPVPEWVYSALPVQPAGPLTHYVMERVADYEVATHLGERPSRFWELMLVTNGAFILRPIRALDLLSYCFPGRDYLQRRYGRSSPTTRVGHSLRAVGQYARLGADTLYFTWDRYRRLKALKMSASLFNRLETEG